MKPLISNVFGLIYALLPTIILIMLIMWALNYFYKISFSLKTFFQILITFPLLTWPLILFASAMLFDHDESLDKRNVLLIANAILLYPVVTTLLMYICDFQLWDINSRNLFIGTLLTTTLFTLSFNYPTLLLNNYRGISNIKTKK